MANPTPQRFSGRAGSELPGRVRRALDAHTESSQRYGKTTEIGPDGRLEARVAKGGGLKLTRDGLTIDMEQVGEKNRPQINRIAEPTTNLVQLQTAVAKMLEEFRRTGRMRS